MICPRCGVALEERAEGLDEDIFLYACPVCGGAFYLEGSLDRLDDALGVDVEDLSWEVAPEPSGLACPHCREEGYRGGGGEALDRVRLAGQPSLELARCPRCACFWLDEDQLDAVRELALRVSSRENAELNAKARAVVHRKRPKPDPHEES